jgi:hypothetical protein
LLRIPGVGDVPPPLLAGFKRLTVPGGPKRSGESGPGHPAGANGTGGDGGDEGRVRLAEKHKVRKRRSASASAAGPHQSSWEHGTSGVDRFRSLDAVRMSWMLGGGALLFGLVVGGIVLALKSVPTSETIASGVAVPAAKAPAGQGAPVSAGQAVTKRSDASILVESEALAKEFLNARTIAEMLPVVRNPERAQARMQREYPEGTIDPPGMTEFNSGKGLLVFDWGAVVTVRTGRFEVRQLNLVNTPAGLRVDWESWVGWTEMSWPEFLATKPTTAQAFRVIVKKVDYYNFDFADDTKWRSFRLESRKGEQTLYGYVARGSDLDGVIQIDPELKKSAMILKVRFPAGASASSNQVLIEEVVHDSWVEPE